MDQEPNKFRYMKKFNPLQFLLMNNFKPVPLPFNLFNSTSNTNPINTINPNNHNNNHNNNNNNNIINNNINIKKPQFNGISPF